MLLEHKYNGYGFKNLSQKETSLYAEYLHDNLSFEMKQRLTNICTYLEKAFPAGNEKQLKKINIPIVFLVADEAIGEGYDSSNKKSTYRVGPRYFSKWFHKFFDENYEEYGQYCSSGSTRLDKTQGRIDCMLNNFKKYFEIETKEIQVEEPVNNTKDEPASILGQENDEESPSNEPLLNETRDMEGTQTPSLPTNEDDNAMDETIVEETPIDTNIGDDTTTAANDCDYDDNNNNIIAINNDNVGKGDDDKDDGVDNEEASQSIADDEQPASFTNGIIADMEIHPLEEEGFLLEDGPQ
jgi:hypothetical protein